jgi:hypothetical protein
MLQSIYQIHRLDWLRPDGILIFFLPALLFEESLKINLRQLTENLVPFVILTTLGGVVTLVAGYLVFWLVRLPMLEPPPFWGNHLRYRRKRVCTPKMFTGGPIWINVASTLK